MTCTHTGIFSPTHHFLEVKFPCLCGGGGGVLPFYPHFSEVKFLCVWCGGGGGGCTFMIRNRGGYHALPHVESFPRFHIFPFSTCPLVLYWGGGGEVYHGGLGCWGWGGWCIKV